MTKNHVAEFRKFIKRILNCHEIFREHSIPEVTFYIWLELKDEIEFTKTYIKRKYKSITWKFLGRNGLGKGYIRIALVENEEKQEVLTRLKGFYRWIKKHYFKQEQTQILKYLEEQELTQ